jgi:uncharacterized protein (TIGR02147 family)
MQHGLYIAPVLKPELNYRSLLKMKLADKIAANPSYSLRAMARDVKLSPSLLSDVMKGNKNLSAETAVQVAGALKFTHEETEYFTILVQIEGTKSADLKARLFERLRSLRPKAPVYDLSVEVFRTISEWYHLPILELTHVTSFELTAASAAKALGISTAEADAAIERLLRLELLEKNAAGKLKKSDSFLLTSSAVPSEALRRFHGQMLKKAVESLAEQTPKEKFVGSETFAFDEKNLAKASKLLEECFSKIIDLAGSSRSKSAVYHLGIQMFRLTQKEASK